MWYVTGVPLPATGAVQGGFVYTSCVNTSREPSCRTVYVCTCPVAVPPCLLSAFTNGSAWSPAVAAPVQSKAVLSWHSVPITVDATYAAVSVEQPVAGQYVIDFGQNMAGQTTTRVICADGPQTISYLYGESLHPDGTGASVLLCIYHKRDDRARWHRCVHGSGVV